MRGWIEINANISHTGSQIILHQGNLATTLDAHFHDDHVGPSKLRQMIVVGFQRVNLSVPEGQVWKVFRLRKLNQVVMKGIKGAGRNTGNDLDRFWAVLQRL